MAPELWSELQNEIVPKVLFTAMTRQGDLFVWHIRLPDVDGKLHEWNKSALEAAKHAETKWVRIAANQSVGAYDVYEAIGEIPDPNWTGLSFQEIIKIAFKGKIIDSLDHPVLKRLRGET